jgi:hypothetical protein
MFTLGFLETRLRGLALEMTKQTCRITVLRQKCERKEIESTLLLCVKVRLRVCDHFSHCSIVADFRKGCDPTFMSQGMNISKIQTRSGVLFF